MSDPLAIFYVYILFDENAIPRYVGKGRGSRWLQHDSGNDPNNSQKNKFVKQVIMAMGEVPKVKIRENLTEPQAFELEAALIKSIGRFPNGPLTNLTDKRNGPTSERIKEWHASRTPEERQATARKGIITRSSRFTPKEWGDICRKNNAHIDRKVKSDRMAKMQASLSSEERKANATKAGIASAAATSPEEKIAHGLKGIAAYMAGTTPEQRKENAKRGGVAKLTKEQLSDNGRKGVATANASRTPQERSALARKAALAGALKRRMANPTMPVL